MVDAGGYRIRMLIEGRGSPAVVIVSGGFGGASWKTWEDVRGKVREFTRVVIYDRGGAGGSEPAPLPRDSEHIASELHTALRNAGVEPPYVLVGQSIGGIHARVFAHRYPADMAGLVLVEPTPEDFEAELLRTRTPEQRRRLQEQMADFARDVRNLPAGSRAEHDAVPADYQQARAAWPLPAVPVILISSRHVHADLEIWSPAIWLGLHEDLIRRTPGGKHIITEKSDHSIQMSEPYLVVGAIREVVKR
jgi:pimeloyl-ACP methyl ester carboxylesterase